MVFLNLIFIFSLSFLLIKSVDMLIINLKKLSRNSRLGYFVTTSIIVALATSLPEFFVGISSAIAGSPSLSLGNVIGANMANLSLVVGGAALVGGQLVINGSFLKNEVFYVFLAGTAPMILLHDRTLSRFDGLILLGLYGFYLFSLLTKKRKRITDEHLFCPEGVIRKIIRRLSYSYSNQRLKEFGWICLASAILLFSANLLVKIAIKLASQMNVPLLLIGLFVVSIGTTLPELIFEIKAARRHQPSMIFGNLLGSLVTNSTLIVGTVSLISPFKVYDFRNYLLSTIAYVVIFALFYLFVRTKSKLERWEGAFLLGFYLALVFFEFTLGRQY